MASAKYQEIEILRALSIIIVLIGHLPSYVPEILRHGYTGVSLFFVISGFVVSKSLLSSETINNRSLFNFYVRRAFRIIPTATIWIGLYYLISQILASVGGSYGDQGRWQKEVGWYFSGAYNYYYAYSEMPGLFGHYWSLFVEMHFYFVMPFIFVFFRRKPWQIAVCSVLVVLVSIILRPMTDARFAGFLTHSQFDALLAGVLIYLLAAPSMPAISVSKHSHGIAKFSVFSALFVTLWLLPAHLDFTSTPGLKYPIFTLLSVTLVYLAQRNEAWISFGSDFVDRFLVYVGSRSFSIYVCHIIIFSGVFPTFMPKIAASVPADISPIVGNPVLQAIVLCGMALAAAELSFRLIETPFIRLGRRLIVPTKPAYAAGSTVRSTSGD